MRWLDGITDSIDMSLINSRSWRWTGRPGVLQSMGSQRVRHDWATEINWACQLFISWNVSLVLYLTMLHIHKVTKVFYVIFWEFYSFVFYIYVYDPFWINFYAGYKVCVLFFFFHMRMSSCPNTTGWRDYLCSIALLVSASLRHVSLHWPVSTILGVVVYPSLLCGPKKNDWFLSLFTFSLAGMKW